MKRDALLKYAPMPKKSHDVMMRAARSVEEEKIVKKKMSVGLVMTIVMVLLVATALAVTVWNAYFEKAIEMEADMGYFQDWELDDKLALVDMMVEAGFETDADMVARLASDDISDEDKDATATAIVTAYYGEGHNGVLSVIDMMEKEKGPLGTWTLEEQEWFSKMQAKYNHSEKNGAWAIFTTPGPNDLSREEAIGRARKVLKDEFFLSDEAIDTMEVEVTFEAVSDDTDKWNQWYILFYPADSKAPYQIELSNDGNIISSHEPVVSTNSILFRFLALEEEKGAFFRDWSIEDKAAFTKEWIGVVENAKAAGETIPDNIQAIAEQKFCIPTQTELTQTDAVEKAMEHLREDGWNEEDFAVYDTDISFLANRLDVRVWRIVYRIEDIITSMDRVNAMEIPYGRVIEVDAGNGNVLGAYELKKEDPLF